MAVPRRLVLVMSMLAAGMGCARTSGRALPRPAHDHARPAGIQQQMSALVRKLERATARLERVGEARSLMLDLVPETTEVPSAARVDRERLDKLRARLAEVRRRLYVEGTRFNPDVVSLRRLEAELVDQLMAGAD